MVDPKNVHSMIGKHMLADGMEQVIDLNKSNCYINYIENTLQVIKDEMKLLKKII